MGGAFDEGKGKKKVIWPVGVGMTEDRSRNKEAQEERSVWGIYPGKPATVLDD